MVYESAHRHLGWVLFPFIVHSAHAKTGIIGLASTLYNNFLPFLLASRGAKFGDSSYYITYRNVRILSSFTHIHALITSLQQVILSILGIPGAFLAGWAVEQPYIGRRGTLAISSGKYPSFSLFMVHYSTTPARYLKGSLVFSSLRVRRRGRVMRCWGGIVGMRFIVMYVFCYPSMGWVLVLMWHTLHRSCTECCTPSHPNSSLPKTAGPVTHS